MKRVRGKEEKEKKVRRERDFRLNTGVAVFFLLSTKRPTLIVH
jgi:hypothetical protein